MNVRASSKQIMSLESEIKALKVVNGELLDKLEMAKVGLDKALVLIADLQKMV